MESRWQGLFPALWTPTDASGALVGEALGARGVVSGQSNAIPEWVVAVWKAVVRGDATQAKDESRWLAEFTQITGVLEFPLSIAAGMQARGRPAGEPKAVLSGATRLQLARAIAEAKACLAQAGIH